MRRVTIVMAAVLAPIPAEAEPPSKQRIFCAELRRVVEVAELDGDFTYLERSRAAPPRFGFRHGCRAHAATERLPSAWWCSQTLAPEPLSLASLEARTAACLPEAVRTRGRHGRETIFTLPHARILISEHGGPKAHVGRIVGFRVEKVGEERAR